MGDSNEEAKHLQPKQKIEPKINSDKKEKFKNNSRPKKPHLKDGNSEMDEIKDSLNSHKSAFTLLDEETSEQGAEKNNRSSVPKNKEIDLQTNTLKDQICVPVIGSNRVQSLPQHMIADNTKFQKKFASKLAKQQIPKRPETKLKMPLFSHLVQMERNVNMAGTLSLSRASVHPCFITLGIQSTDGLLFHGSERSCMLIECLITFINDYVTPSEKELIRDFESKLSPSLTFLSQCRPLSSGMGTIVKLLKQKLYDCSTLKDEEIKMKLIEFLNNFRYERIDLAGDVIVSIISQKIVSDDVILTYSLSDIVLNACIKASLDQKTFKVIVADSKPRFDGKIMLRKLVENKIECCYIGLNGLSVAMKQVTKIIIGANAILVNGAVMSPVGAALISVVGKSCNVPFLVCCETYNFSERAQTDAFVYNELGDPDDIITSSNKSLSQFDIWKQFPNVTLLNLYYDIIQPKYVDAIVTELGIIPCTSAPVVLRVKN